MNLAEAYRRGQANALARFKLAGPMGADVAVAPRGDEQSHGTELRPYPERQSSDPVDGQRPDMPDWLWNLSEYDRIAPSRADGTFGQEVIG